MARKLKRLKHNTVVHIRENSFATMSPGMFTRELVREYEAALEAAVPPPPIENDGPVDSFEDERYYGRRHDDET